MNGIFRAAKSQCRMSGSSISNSVTLSMTLGRRRLQSVEQAAAQLAGVSPQEGDAAGEVLEKPARISAAGTPAA